MQTNSNRIIGIMGGSFNPIHNGHLQLAIQSHKQFNISKILVMPSGNPSSYKDTSELVAAKDRCNMVNAAIKDYPFLELSLIEVMREGNTYTSDTLKYLKNEYDYIYFIIGADSLFALERWHEPEYVMQNCHLLAANRDNHKQSELQAQADILTKKYNAKISFLDTKVLPYSSSEIRRRIAAGESINDMVTNDVAEYIKKHNLYI